MTPTKPIASLSLDLDNKWSYLKTHGDPGWDSFPSYLNTVVPRVLDFLQQRELSITFFIVGQDAALGKNQQALNAIAAAGHEIGNHSFHHEPWIHLYNEQQIEAELATAEQHIEQATGQRPVGFRGPGFSLSPTILQVLARRGYLYDATTFPTFLGPLARAYYFMNMRDNLSPDERDKRRALFGAFRDGLRPLKPYRWQTASGALVEIPVTTMPIFKVPIHVSYLLYLSKFIPAIARSYFRAAIQLCQLTGSPLSLLLHPMDFLGCDDEQDLAFFPAMTLPSARKLHLVSDVLRLLSDAYTVLTVQQHADALIRQANLPLVEPRFQNAPSESSPLLSPPSPTGRGSG